MRLYGIVVRPVLLALVWIIVGATGRWRGCSPSHKQRIYFANHTSHIDSIAIWSALPPELRGKTRFVAALDYWSKGILRKYIALKVMRAVLIERTRKGDDHNPLEPVFSALEKGDSLILFPEGTRTDQKLPGAFKSGLYHIAQHFPHVELVPVYLENLHRSMPKGALLPVPITATVWFGEPTLLKNEESKEAFLTRARLAVVELT